MPWLLLAPMTALVAGAAVAAWGAVALERELAALRAEVAASATLRSAHGVLRGEVAAARERRAELGRPTDEGHPGADR